MVARVNQVALRGDEEQELCVCDGTTPLWDHADEPPRLALQRDDRIEQHVRPAERRAAPADGVPKGLRAWRHAWVCHAPRVTVHGKQPRVHGGERCEAF